MHQINPPPFADTMNRYVTPPSRRQAVLLGHFDAFLHLQGDLNAIVCETCRIAVECIGVRFAGVLQYRADEHAFVLQAGIGWPARMIGRTRVAADLDTTAGLAWHTGQLVHFRHLNAIGRIRMPEALVEQGVHRMVSVPIHGGHKEAFGVLEVGTAEAGEFTQRDLMFLQRVADSVAAVVGLHASRAGWTERVELFAERQATLAGSVSTAPGRRGSAGISYQQDAQCGAS